MSGTSPAVPPLDQRPENNTPADAAVWLGVATRTLANWRSQARGPAYCKCGGKVIYRLKDLIHFRDRSRVEPEA